MNKILAIALITFSFFINYEDLNAQSNSNVSLSENIIIVQPIITRSTEGTEPASIALPEDLVDLVYKNASIDFHFLEPIYYDNTEARDGLINLDKIVGNSYKAGYIKGENDIVNMFFVNSVDGHKGPLGRGMLGGNLTFIALGEQGEMSEDEFKFMQTFVITHEVGHNLGLRHAVDDPNVNDTLPNIQGDGPFKDRIDPQYSLNEYQVKEVLKSSLVHPRIELLSKEQGEIGILDESFEPYFSQLQIREIEAFIQEDITETNIDTVRAYARKKFASAVTEFSDSEKECITFVVNNINRILLENGLSTMANHPWRFIKVEDWLCGGFAHTRGTYIIIGQGHIDYLNKSWSNNMTAQDELNLIQQFGSLLVHEQMHSLQRTFNSKFSDLYQNYWGLKNAIVNTEESIIINQVSNPDAPIANWLIPNPHVENEFYLARTLLNKTDGIPIMGKDFVDKVFEVEMKNDNFIIKKDALNKPIELRMNDIPFYKNAYPITRGIDHPNEISAYMFADYFKALVKNTIPFENIDPQAKFKTGLFVKWVKTEM